LPPDDVVRRFAWVWAGSLAVKLAALLVLLVVVVKFLGGP